MGVDHPDVATTLNNLGMCAYRAGRAEEAEELYRRALTIREEKLGVHHPGVAFSLGRLEYLNNSAGRTKEAEEL